MSPMDAAIVNSGSEIGNHCSAIVPASRIARLRKVVAATMPHPIQIFVAAKYNSSACGRSLPLRCRIRFQFSSLQSRAVPPTAPSSRQVERPACGRSLPPRCCVRFLFSLPQSRIAVLRAAIIVLQVVQGYCFKKYCHRLGHVSQGVVQKLYRTCFVPFLLSLIGLPVTAIA